MTDLLKETTITQLDNEKVKEICLKSVEARNSSYSPYSQFKVGAALLCTDGSVVLGCNVENASYGLAICAERTAIVKAVSDNKMDFAAIAVCADLKDRYVSPCGACRQFLAEFNPDMPVYLVRLDGKVQVNNMDQLLPNSFSPKRQNFDFHRGS